MAPNTSIDTVNSLHSYTIYNVRTFLLAIPNQFIAVAQITQ